MEIRFECECYDRTLVVQVPQRYMHLTEEMIRCLCQYYDEWIYCETEDTEVMCLEEYIMYRFMDKYDRTFVWYVEED